MQQCNDAIVLYNVAMQQGNNSDPANTCKTNVYEKHVLREKKHVQLDGEPCDLSCSRFLSKYIGDVCSVISVFAGP